MSYKVTGGQNIVDVAIEQLGGLNQLVSFVNANDIGLTSLLLPDQELTLIEPERQEIVGFFSKKSTRVNTGQNETLTEIQNTEFNVTIILSNG